MARYVSSALLALPLAAAFPALANIDPSILALGRRAADECNTGLVCSTHFNAADQYVDVSPGSKHAFVAPGKGDLRGECPGLNAAANHGFLPHNGIVSLAQTVEGLGKAYSMSVDLSTFLSVVAIALSGDVVTQQWSIGGPFAAAGLDGLLSQPKGLTGTHNKYEGDASFSRYDAYLNNGNAGALRMESFKKFYDMGEEYTFRMMREHNLYVANYSLYNNPEYFSAPFAGLVTPAAHEFIINFMSNHSAERPSGYLNRNILKTFFSISGPDDNLTWLPFHEQIPQAWYKRPSSNPYTIAGNVADTVITGTEFPGSVRIGGNTGTVNSFVGVDIPTLTGGTYNATSLLNPNSLACFMIQLFEAALPDQLAGLVSDLTTVLGFVKKHTGPLLADFGCPQLAAYDPTPLKQFPGSTYSPTYKNKH